MVELKNKVRSKKSASLYYDVFVDGNYICKLRVSDHVHEKQSKYLFYWSYTPWKVKENTLINFVKEQLTRKEKFNIASSIMPPLLNPTKFK